MCRHLAYLGEPVTLAALLLEPPFGLLRQSYAPRQQRYGRVNADGFGVGWYVPALRPEPARYRRATPLWSDQSFASVAAVTTSGAVLAAVRSATAGFPVDEAGAAPFTAGRWLFSLNGRVEDFGRVAPLLHAHLPAAASAAVEGPSDAALVWALTRHHLEQGAGCAEALLRVVEQVTAVAGERLNLLLTDGDTVAATVLGDTLSVRCLDSGVTVASEPGDDDPTWTPVPDGSLVLARRDGVSVTPLSADRAVPSGGVR